MKRLLMEGGGKGCTWWPPKAASSSSFKLHTSSFPRNPFPARCETIVGTPLAKRTSSFHDRHEINERRLAQRATHSKLMAHELPALPYPTNALEPHIDAKTMEIHHGKHHAAYVTNLN